MKNRNKLLILILVLNFWPICTRVQATPVKNEPNQPTADLTSQNKVNGNEILFNNGVQAYNQKKYADALTDFEKELKSSPNNSNALYYEALTLQAMSDYANALKYYQKIIELNTDKNAVNYAKMAVKQLSGLSLKCQTTDQDNQTLKSKQVSKRPQNNSAKPENKSAEKLSQDTLPDSAGIYYTKTPGSTLLLVEGTVNGTPTQFYFDTGAGNVFFSKQQLMNAGSIITAGSKATKTGGVGSTELMNAYLVKVDINVGGIKRSNFPVIVSDDYNISGNSAGYPLLGREFWRGYMVDIDSSSNMIRFYKESANNCPPGIDVPFRLYGTHIIVNVTVNGGTMPMIFDTGASGLCFTEKQAMAANIMIPANAKTAQSSGVSGTTQAVLVNVPFLALGPIQLTDIQAQVVFASLQPYPLLGQSVFGSNWEYIINYTKKTIRFISR